MRLFKIKYDHKKIINMNSVVTTKPYICSRSPVYKFNFQFGSSATPTSVEKCWCLLSISPLEGEVKNIIYVPINVSFQHGKGLRKPVT